jgi:hypothetical protein
MLRTYVSMYACMHASKCEHHRTLRGRFIPHRFEPSPQTSASEKESNQTSRTVIYRAREERDRERGVCVCTCASASERACESRWFFTHPCVCVRHAHTFLRCLCWRSDTGACASVHCAYISPRQHVSIALISSWTRE